MKKRILALAGAIVLSSFTGCGPSTDDRNTSGSSNANSNMGNTANSSDSIDNTTGDAANGSTADNGIANGDGNMGSGTDDGENSAATDNGSSPSGSQDTPGSTGTSESEERPDVKLTVWGEKEEHGMLRAMIEDFKEQNVDTANWKIRLVDESEENAKADILNNPEEAADVFVFPDSQLDELANAGALQEITLDTETVIEDNGGQESSSVKAAMKDGKLYAYPMTTDNGYFLFYNKEYFPLEQDTATLDRMMEIAGDRQKKVTMAIDEGWYLYSFFAGAGFLLSENDDGTNTCNWNTADGQYKGTDVLQAILDIVGNKGFKSMKDGEFAKGVKDGSVIAGVSGIWNAAVAKKAWGENYAAAKLPTYTCMGTQVQMGSFATYKLMGVNAHSKNAGYAMMLGQYLTNYVNQVKRFQVMGFAPTNVKAADTGDVKSNPAIAALVSQAQHATVQRVGDRYWDAAATLGASCIGENPGEENYQPVLDAAVEGITAQVQ